MKQWIAALLCALVLVQPVLATGTGNDADTTNGETTGETADNAADATGDDADAAASDSGTDRIPSTDPDSTTATGGTTGTNTNAGTTTGTTGNTVDAKTATITNFNAQWAVDAKGRATATIRVDMNLPSTVTQLDFPIGNGVNAQLSGYSDVEIVDITDGKALRLVADPGFTGVQTFTLSYAVENAIKVTETGQKLELDLMAPGWAWPMEQASFTLTMPAVFTGEPTYVGGYYADLVADYMTLEQTDTTITGTYKEPLRDHESLSISLDLPVEYITIRSASGISQVVTLSVTILLAVLALLYWYKTLSNGKMKIVSRTMAPDGVGAGELPLLLMGGRPRLSLQVAQWASLGYLVMGYDQRGRVVLQKTMDMGTERRQSDQVTFQKLFGENTVCEGEGRRFAALADWYAHNMERSCRRRYFSRTSGAPLILYLLGVISCAVALFGAASAGLPAGKLRGLLLALVAVLGLAAGVSATVSAIMATRRQFQPVVLGVFLPLVALVLAVVWGGVLPMVIAFATVVFGAVATMRGGRRSAAGQNITAQALGFRRYIQYLSTHQLTMQLRDNGLYFYDLLPFTEAMGLSDDLASRVDRFQIEPCPWFRARRKQPQTPPGFTAAFQDMLRRMDNSGR